VKRLPPPSGVVGPTSATYDLRLCSFSSHPAARRAQSLPFFTQCDVGRRDRSGGEAKRQGSEEAAVEGEVAVSGGEARW
jgi:hypothetical protein